MLGSIRSVIRRIKSRIRRAHEPGSIYYASASRPLAGAVRVGLPTWAALSAGGIRSLILPTTLKELVIFADHDEAGINAAGGLADRYINQVDRLRIAIPPERGADFNDIFLGA